MCDQFTIILWYMVMSICLIHKRNVCKVPSSNSLHHCFCDNNFKGVIRTKLSTPLDLVWKKLCVKSLNFHNRVFGNQKSFPQTNLSLFILFLEDDACLLLNQSWKKCSSVIVSSKQLWHFIQGKKLLMIKISTLTIVSSIGSSWLRC